MIKTRPDALVWRKIELAFINLQLLTSPGTKASLSWSYFGVSNRECFPRPSCTWDSVANAAVSLLRVPLRACLQTEIALATLDSPHEAFSCSHWSPSRFGWLLTAHGAHWGCAWATTLKNCSQLWHGHLFFSFAPKLSFWLVLRSRSTKELRKLSWNAPSTCWCFGRFS